MEEAIVGSFIYEELLSDEHDSSSEDEEVLVLATNLAAQSKQKKERGHLFLNRVDDDDGEFQQDFRLRRQAFDYLLEKIKPLLKSESASKDTIDAKVQLLVTIWVLSTPDSFRSIAKQFDMSKSSIWVCFERTIKAICSVAHDFIKWPSRENRRLVEEEFNKISKIRGIVGAIDGTYVAIKAPTQNPEVYINRKAYHAITLQAVCGSKKKFFDIFVGYPSSVGDRRILINSEFHRNVTNNLNIYFDENQFIVGDKAYPNYNWLLAPYFDRGNMTQYQKNFNKCHSSTRSVIERAFALLFGRFRRLKYLDMSRIDLIPTIVLAATVLHNICLMFDDEYEDQYIEEGQGFLQQREAENNVENYDVDVVTAEGNLRRDNIARNLPRY